MIIFSNIKTAPKVKELYNKSNTIMLDKVVIKIYIHYESLKHKKLLSLKIIFVVKLKNIKQNEY